LLRLEAESELARSDDHRDALLQEILRMHGQVSLWRHRSNRPEASTSEPQVRLISGGVRRCRGFRELVVVS
jgi:hypothetical protein